MKRRNYKKLAGLIFALGFLSVGIANAQIQAAGGGYYVAGYGRVYGSFGQASVAQSRMYDTVKSQNRKTSERDALIQKWGLAAVEKAEREASSGAKRSAPSNPQIVVSPRPVVRNYGVFRRDPTVDTGKALADALGETPEEKTLIKNIYTATKTTYEKEAAAKGWANNVAGGLTFFTVAALVAYQDAEEPGADTTAAYFAVMNAALDETPGFASASNKDKQGFNNMLIGFSGILVATYVEAKESKDVAALANCKKLAGMLIEMVLKTDPENLQIENDRIVMK